MNQREAAAHGRMGACRSTWPLVGIYTGGMVHLSHLEDLLVRDELLHGHARNRDHREPARAPTTNARGASAR